MCGLGASYLISERMRAPADRRRRRLPARRPARDRRRAPRPRGGLRREEHLRLADLWRYRCHSGHEPIPSRTFIRDGSRRECVGPYASQAIQAREEPRGEDPPLSPIACQCGYADQSRIGLRVHATHCEGPVSVPRRSGLLERHRATFLSFESARFLRKETPTWAGLRLIGPFWTSSSSRLRELTAPTHGQASQNDPRFPALWTRSRLDQANKPDPHSTREDGRAELTNLTISKSRGGAHWVIHVSRRDNITRLDTLTADRGSVGVASDIVPAALHSEFWSE